MIVCVPTVMHTGTHVIRNQVFSGFQEIHFKGLGFQGNKGQVVGHLLNNTVCHWIKAFDKFGNIFMPIRHPSRVLESFRRRDKCERFYREQWDLFLEIGAAYDITYLHIDDLALRDKQVVRISEQIGMPVTPSWELEGSEHGTHDMEITQGLLDQTPERYIRFYEDTK